MKKIALMIDGDNISAQWLDRVTAHAKDLGDVVFSRVYMGKTPGNGDWTGSGIPMFVTGTSDNAADFRLSLDAAEIATKGVCDTFMIVSNDGDLSNVVVWLRERGHKVITMGTDKASKQMTRDIGSFVKISSTNMGPEDTMAAIMKEIACYPDGMNITAFGQWARKQMILPTLFGSAKWLPFFRAHEERFTLRQSVDDVNGHVHTFVGLKTES